jgi:hypothetical protein
MRAFTLPLLCCATAGLVACGSAPKQADTVSAETPAAAATAPTAAPVLLPEWQVLRARHFDCAQARASELMRGTESATNVARQAVRACDAQLASMRKSFHQYLETQMTSSHGKAGARRAADQLARDTEQKVQAHLEQSVTYSRYQAKLQ